MLGHTTVAAPAWLRVGAGMALVSADGSYNSSNSLTIPGTITASNGVTAAGGSFTGNASGLTNIPHLVAECTYGTNETTIITNAVTADWVAATNTLTLTSGSMAGWQVVTNSFKYTNASSVMLHTATSVSFSGDSATERDYAFCLMKNGEPIREGRAIGSVSSANVQTTAFHTFIMVNQNDIIQLGVKQGPDAVASSVRIYALNLVSMSLK